MNYWLSGYVVMKSFYKVLAITLAFIIEAESCEGEINSCVGTLSNKAVA